MGIGDWGLVLNPNKAISSTVRNYKHKKFFPD